mmetsp:Transcript_131832/g.381293  ORF Transcript_131832/g.381293 Transcript_131832/m.381293 type:complete len:260 (+) Transcript_131832:565-1344(+)
MVQVQAAGRELICDSPGVVQGLRRRIVLGRGRIVAKPRFEVGLHLESPTVLGHEAAIRGPQILTHVESWSWSLRAEILAMSSAAASGAASAVRGATFSKHPDCEWTSVLSAIALANAFGTSVRALDPALSVEHHLAGPLHHLLLVHLLRHHADHLLQREANRLRLADNPHHLMVIMCIVLQEHLGARLLAEILYLRALRADERAGASLWQRRTNDKLARLLAHDRVLLPRLAPSFGVFPSRLLHNLVDHLPKRVQHLNR